MNLFIINYFHCMYHREFMAHTATKKMKKFVLLWASLAFVFSTTFYGCSKDDGLVPGAPGDVISYDSLTTLSLANLEQIRNANMDAFITDTAFDVNFYRNRFAQPQYPVTIYAVKYWSVIPEFNQRSTVATGLLAIPVTGNSAMPMISYQHGTVFDKSWAPSIFMNSLETQFMALQFASQGYMLIAADYFGIGNVSTEVNSYFVRESNEQACLDMYRASQQILQEKNLQMTKFFINGWSQGAYNTMTFLRRLEQEGIPVTAAFTAACPMDPQFFVSRALLNPRPFDADFTVAALSNMILSIEYYRQLDGLAERYIKPEYVDIARKFHRFEMNFLEFIDTVPPVLSVAFTAELFADAQSGQSPFFQVLAASEAYRWLSPTPLRTYYGMKDEVVPDYGVLMAVDYMITLGKTNVEAINAGSEADHRKTYLESLADGKAWIDSF